MFKHYEVKDLNKNRLAWYGYRRKGYPETIMNQIREEKESAHKARIFSERECEVDCFLKVLSESNGEFNMMDLGSGWGEWSLALSGVINNKIIPTKISDYYTVAVECDKYFYDFAVENFKTNNVKGKVIYGAVSDKDGTTKINTGSISKKYCGSSLSFSGYFSNSRMLALASGCYHYFTKQTDDVPMFSLNSLIKKYFPDKDINLIVMDIQGAETLALENLSDKNLIEYMMIGTHGYSVHNKVKSILAESYEFIVDAPPSSITQIDDNYKVVCKKGQDGIILCKSKI